MITDRIENYKRYLSIDSRMEEIFKFLSSLSCDTPNGKYSLDGGVTVNISDLVCVPEDKQPFEEHHRYADIHMLLSGWENLDCADSDSLSASGSYNEENDYVLYDPIDKNTPFAYNRIMLNVHNFAFVFPYEAHRPLVLANGRSEAIRKVVVKIPFEKE